MKRKTASDEAGSQSVKTPRSDNDGDEEDSRPWDKRPGMIMEVNLKNFMCHETFSFRPNLRLNFLCGVNGSGKSAVLTAIVFGLGGTARMASRGNSNKGFIRTGQPSATVEIRLCNEGENSYRPELYGDSIIVVRTVTNTSSTYKLKDHRGRIVVERKVKEELDRILMNFNIQVDNPIAVLNQDTAKTFLFKCEPDKLYTFFMRATQLEACKADYNSAAVEKSQAEAHLEEKKTSLPELKREMEKWKKKYEFHQNLKVRKQDIKVKKAELAWARVRDVEIELEEKKTNLDIENKKLPMCDEKIEISAAKEKELRNRKKEIETEIQEIAKNQDRIAAELKKLKTDFKNEEEKAKTVRKSLAELKRRKESLVSEAQALSEEIEKMRSGEGRAEYEQRHKRRQEEMNRTEQEVAALNAQVETSSNHLRHLQANQRDLDNHVMQLKGDLQKERGKVLNTTNNLKELKQGGQSKLAAFGNYMPRLVEEIKKSKKFKKQPIGPLGAHINIIENTDQELARAVEHEVSGLLTSFLCDNSNDQRELFNLFGRLGVKSKPIVFTCPFTPRRHDIARDSVYSDQYPTLINCLDIQDPNVFNRVVDSCSLERILYIPTTSEAQTLLDGRVTPPANLNYATVANSYQYYPAPDYKSYHREDRSRGLLRANMEELISQMEDQLRGEEEAVTRVDQAIKDASNEKVGHRRNIDAEETKIKTINRKICDLNNKLTDLRNEEDNEAPVDIAALGDDLDQRKEKIEDIEKKCETLKQDLKIAEESAKEARNIYNEAEQNDQTRKENIEPLNDQLSKLESDIKKAKRDKDYYNDKKDEYKKKIVVFENAVTEKQTLVDELSDKAKVWSEERVDGRKKVESLAREIAKMEESLKRQEETQESRELVTSKFESLTVTFERANKQAKHMEKTVDYLSNMLDKRKTGFKKILRFTGQNINRNFTLQLNARNYIGRLEFDHKTHTLTIVVNPDSNSDAAALDINRDIRTLSGGEKSYSSVSLILALWNAMNPPFRVLDEFDVFMDAVNRRVSLENIINYAKTDRKYQFVFLTPLNTDNIQVGQDLKIIKLAKRAA